MLAKLREPERAALAEFVALLKAKYPRQIAKVVLFGSKARKEREDADYKYKQYTEEQARQIIADCERFVARTQRYLRDVGASE